MATKILPFPARTRPRIRVIPPTTRIQIGPELRAYLRGMASTAEKKEVR